MPDIDYAALAAQARKQPASIDYAQLADQARKGTVNEPPATPTVDDMWKQEQASKAGVVKTALSNAPVIGGAIGGIVGSIPGAALGGAAGTGVKALYEKSSEIGPALADVGRNLISQPAATATGFTQGATSGALDATKDGAIQGALQTVGVGAAKLASPMSKWLMSRATSRVSAKLMQDFPDLNDTLIANALTVSKGGYEKALGLLKTAKAGANGALATADASGATVPLQLTPDVAQSLKTAMLERAMKIGQVPLTPGSPVSVASQRLDPATQAFFKRIDTAADGGLLDVIPSHADALKTQLQKESRALYANRMAPNGQRAIGQTATELAEYASRLNDTVGGAAPGYRDANAAAQPLIGAVRGIKQAIRPSGNLYQAMVRPAVGAMIGEEAGRRNGVNPWVSGIAGAAVTSPAGMSREAIMLASPAAQAALRQLPNALRMAILGGTNDSEH